MSWRSPRPERLLAFVALAVVLGGAAVPSVARAVSTRVRVWDALPLSGTRATLDPSHQLVPDPVEAGGRDPWGRPWRAGALGAAGTFRGTDRVVWSVGPDGVDALGEQDDVRIDPSVAWVDDTPVLAVWIALVLLWLAATVRALRAPSGAGLFPEVVWSAVAASGPAVLAVLALSSSHEVRTALASATPRGIPPFLSALGTCWIALTLPALAWRARRSAPRTGGRVPWRSLVVGAIAAVVAATGAQRAGQRVRARRERQRLLGLACLGEQKAVHAIVTRSERGGVDALEDLAALLESPPALDLTSATLQAVRERLPLLGPQANRLMVRALSGPGAASRTALRHLLAHDPGLEALAAAVRADPARHRELIRSQVSLVCAFAGARAVVELLLADPDEGSQRLAARLTELLGGPEATDTAERRRSWWAEGPAIPDGWVLVAFDAAHDRTTGWRWSAQLVGSNEVERVQVGADRELVVLGPEPPAPAGQRLVLVGPSTIEVELPAIGAGYTWAEVDTDARRASARWIARPR